MTIRGPDSTGSEDPAPVSNDDVDRLVGYIRSAARLRLEILPFAKDRNSKADGITIHYASDTNLLMLYVNPSNVGPRAEQGGGGYGVVFDDDEPDSARSLGAAISRFAFYSLTGERPLLLLPGHDVEIRRFYDAVTLDASHARQQADKQRQQLKSKLIDLVAIPELERQIEWVEGEAPAFFSFLFDANSPRARWSRLNRILSDGRVMRLAAAISQSQLFRNDAVVNEHTRNAFSMPAQLEHVIEESSYRLSWGEMLKKVQPARKTKSSLKLDIKALARLELINRHLGDQPHRLVLISGDEGILKAAQQYKPEWIGKNLTFASLYLRHPRAFLAAPEVLRAPESKTENSEFFVPIVDWLDTLLASYSGYRSINEDTLRMIISGGHDISDKLNAQVRNALKNDQCAARLIQKEWEKYTKDLQKAHSLVSSIARAEIRRVFKNSLGRSAYDMLESLDRHYLQVNEDTWTEFFNALMRTGYDLLDDVERTRNPPPISFGSFHKSRNFLRQIISSKGPQDLTAAKFEVAIGTLDDDGGTGYIRALAYAVLYACSGRWHVAVQIAQRAIDIAERVRAEVDERIKSGGSVDAGRRSVSGREAYYFKAAAQRLLARSVADLEYVDSLLERASDALIYDKERDEQPKPSALRFRAERAAVKLTGYLCLRFAEKGPVNENINSMKSLLNEFTEMLHQSKIEDDPWIRYNVERNILTNIFTVASLLDSDNALDDHMNDCLRHNAMQLLENISCPAYAIDFKIPITRLVRAVSDYAVARFGQPERKDKKKILDDVKRLETDLDHNQDSVVVMPYDRQRFCFLIKLTQKALSQSMR